MKRYKSPGIEVDHSQWYADALTDKFKGEGDFASKCFTVRHGRKYDKIMQGRTPDKMESIHCFVDKGGWVYKAAGLNAPAKGVRFTSVAEALAVADLYGGYLYIR